MQNRGTAPIQTPEQAAEEARLKAEAERLQGELEQITEKVNQIAGQTRHAMGELLQEHQARLAFLKEQLATLEPLLAKAESVPPSPLAEVMLEKLDASKELFEAGIRLVGLQLDELQANLAASEGELDPEARFADISQAPDYLLAKAETDVAGARLKLADWRLPMSILGWYFEPQRKETDNELVLQIRDALDKDSALKIEMNHALSTFKEALDLLAEGKKIIRGIRQFDWSLDLINEFGEKVWGKLKGKLHHLDRVAEQVANTPLSAIFIPKEPSEPLPYQREHAWIQPVTQAPGGTGRLKETGKLGQTGKLGGTGRLINKQG